MKQSKKRVSLFCAVMAVCTCTLSAVQHILFYIANKKQNTQQISQKIYQSKEGAITYSVYGTGRPLLLLHNTEIGASSLEWQNNIESLSRMYQVFVPDLPGFGNSQKSKITYTAYQYALFINHFITDIIQRSAFVVASSASADFAVMAYALNHDNIRKLVLISPTAFQNTIPTERENRKRILYQLPLIGTQIFILSASKKAIKKNLTENLFFSKEIVTKQLIENYYTMAHRGNEIARFSFASVQSQFLYADIQKTLKEMKIPLCIVWGKQNRCNPPEQMDNIKSIRPYDTYFLFENTRILPHFENSKVFNENIHSFLQ
ncbi:alpha/beta fold hydrolase [Clostridium sp. MD294]|uniref:alpha/beta fold hydrolase n=1 Tax=Clostridium sp. MD294 TaxID=97138 RepID=UPI0002CA048F|nr:alpha/beta fold hydrolase [Clostridium sp. MD294]NDO46279.1 alpha/beta fold hydrolase [Clostridium sp. MD294]USF29294.1 AB hydrolase superfamily protein YdjP [Clostridium sp. MD294]